MPSYLVRTPSTAAGERPFSGQTTSSTDTTATSGPKPAAARRTTAAPKRVWGSAVVYAPEAHLAGAGDRVAHSTGGPGGGVTIRTTFAPPAVSSRKRARHAARIMRRRRGSPGCRTRPEESRIGNSD